MKPRWPWEAPEDTVTSRRSLLARAWLCGALPTPLYAWLWASLDQQRETWRWN